VTPPLRRVDAATTGLFVVVAAAVLLAVTAVAATAVTGFAGPRTALAFGAFIALGEVVRITLPGGRDAAPIALAGSLAYALLTRSDRAETTHSALQVVAVVTLAMLVGVVPHVVARRAPSLDALARRLLVVGFVAAVFGGTGLDERAQDWGGAVVALIMIAIVATSLAVDAMLAAAVRAVPDGAPYLAVLRNETQALVGIGSAIGATGALIALAATIMGAWALPVFVIPLLLTQFAFRRFAEIRATSLQTIRALSQVTELGGYTETGHSRRVSDLALGIGREMGMTDAQLLDLEYAALMHDIGQLSLQEPIPGGATVVAAPAEQRRIASLGADVIRAAGVLDGVVAIVEAQAEPYRQAHQIEATDVPLGARIVKVANAYDDLVGDSLEASRRVEALERLRLGMAYEYDPRVVDSLTKTIGRAARY
jgi:HD superfamily phosphodiesterase